MSHAVLILETATSSSSKSFGLWQRRRDRHNANAAYTNRIVNPCKTKNRNLQYGLHCSPKSGRIPLQACTHRTHLSQDTSVVQPREQTLSWPELSDTSPIGLS